MSAFCVVESVAAFLPEQNIDTDIIYPARFLLVMDRVGLGQYLFRDRRTTAPGGVEPRFILDRPPFDQARVLIAGAGFGCGSSREQAVWALADFGIRCVIAPDFGEIFFANALKNAILPLALPHALVRRLGVMAEAGATFRVDLASGDLSINGETVAPIVLPAGQREALLSGHDEIDMLLGEAAAAIDTFEARHRTLQPWLFEGAP